MASQPATLNLNIVLDPPSPSHASTAWMAAMQRYEAAQVCGDPELETKATRELILMPAPDNAALGFKLVNLLVFEEDGFTASWSSEYVRQTLIDCARLLGSD